MFCPVCGSQINENMKFCPNCGTRFDKTDDEEIEADRLIQNKQMIKTANHDVLCPKCGRTLEPGKPFCTYCGATVPDNRDFEKYPLPNSAPPMPYGVNGFDKRPKPKRASPAGKILILLILIILVVLYFVLFR